MEARAHHPVPLPHPHPTPSYWQDPPDPLLSNYLSSPTLPDTVVDTVIIGSGITGASVAWNLLQSDGFKEGGSGGGKRICVLEAREACSGATGRNGGHTKAASYRTFLSNATHLGTSEAIKIARFEYDNITSLHAFATSHSIPCDSWQGDTVDVIYDPAQWEESLKGIDAIRAAMGSPEDLAGVARYRVWSKEEVREKWHVKGEECIGAISYAAGSVSAYKFVVGLLKLCLKLSSGFRLYTNTPATSLHKASDVWVVSTSRGEVRAKRVVLATNGYTGAIWPAFQGRIVPLRGQVTAHRPGSNMPRSGLKGTYSFIYKEGYEYMIPRPLGSKYEGDIVIGGGLTKARDGGLWEVGNTDDSTTDPDISRYLTETTKRYFGEQWGDDHPEGRIRKEWTGVMGFSADGHPFVGEVPALNGDGKGGEENMGMEERGEEIEEMGLWVVASFQGHGMVLCWGVARGVVGMMEGKGEGKQEEEVGELFPEAFRITGERMRVAFKGIH